MNRETMSEFELKILNDFPEIMEEIELTPRESCLAFGVNCGEGWHDILYDLLRDIYIYTQQNNIDIKVNQIKEKFGTLNVYLSDYPEVIKCLLCEAEKKSAVTCEFCGAEGEIRPLSWIKTLCQDCFGERLKTHAIRRK